MLATAAFLRRPRRDRARPDRAQSQKAGPVVSHLRLAATDADGRDARGAPANGVGEASADLLLAFDLLVAAEPRHLSRLAARTAR